MGLMKWLKEKREPSWTYIVDEKTLREYLRREIGFSLKEKLEASADLNIYLHGRKHHIQVWNYGASRDKDERKKGLIIYYDDAQYRTLEDLMDYALRFLPEYFKIELTLGDDVFLNEFKASHPELRAEDHG